MPIRPLTDEESVELQKQGKTPIKCQCGKVFDDEMTRHYWCVRRCNGVDERAAK